MQNLLNNTDTLVDVVGKMNAVVTEVAAQATQIEEIMGLLDGKSVPSGGEDVTEETEAYTELLDDLEAAIDELPSGGSSGVETGTIVGVTTLADSPDAVRYYFDLENIPNVASKLLIVLIDANTSSERFVLTRTTTSDSFTISNHYVDQPLPQSFHIDDYVFSMGYEGYHITEVLYFAA